MHASALRSKVSLYTMITAVGRHGAYLHPIFMSSPPATSFLSAPLIEIWIRRSARWGQVLAAGNAPTHKTLAVAERSTNPLACSGD